jgi:two-component system sensor histidine kinase/response regulator
MRQQFPDFIVWKPGGADGRSESPPADEYWVIQFTEPFARNAVSLGLDVRHASSGPHYAIAEQVGGAQTTAGLRLVQETATQVGAIVIEPVYRDDEQRPIGFVALVMRLGDLTGLSLAEHETESWAIELHDSMASNDDPTLLHAMGADASQVYHDAPYALRIPIMMPGREWVLQLCPSYAYVAQTRRYGAWVILIGGSLVVALLGLLLQSIADRGQLVVAEVRSKTAELADANRQLIKARDDAEEGDRAKSAFLATMSHEIRTPMNGVIGMVDLLLLTELSSQQREYATTVRDSGECLLALINDILDLSKIDAGRIDLERVPMSVRSIASEAMRFLGVQGEQKNLDMWCLIEPDVAARLEGDPGRLRQVLLNLVGNAIKFTETGEVVVEIKVLTEESVHRRQQMYFTVSDTGIGIAADKQAELFQPFMQADASMNRRYGGTGLGLAISRRIVTAMGGALTVASEAGAGSVFSFTIELPIHERGASQVILPRNLTVIAAGTDPRFCAALRSCCDGTEVPVVTPNEPEALARSAVLAKGPCVILVHLDEEAVWLEPALAAARAKVGAPAVVMALARSHAEAPAYEVNRVLYKPLLREPFLEAVRGALDAQQALRKIPQRKLVEVRGARVLLVEDNPINQRVARAMLSKLECVTLLASSGAEAVARLTTEGDLDLVLMDCQMPEMDGYEATERYREWEQDLSVPRHLPIVAMTANAMDEDRRRCYEAGMDDFLSKPVTLEQLRATIARHRRGGSASGARQALDPNT